MNSQTTNAPPSLMRMRQVLQKTGKSRTAIYDAIAAGEFPRQVALGPRSVAWSSDEIDAWILTRIAQRDAGQEGAQ